VEMVVLLLLLLFLMVVVEMVLLLMLLLFLVVVVLEVVVAVAQEVFLVFLVFPFLMEVEVAVVVPELLVLRVRVMAVLMVVMVTKLVPTVAGCLMLVQDFLADIVMKAMVVTEVLLVYKHFQEKKINPDANINQYHRRSYLGRVHTDSSAKKGRMYNGGRHQPPCTTKRENINKHDFFARTRHNKKLELKCIPELLKRGFFVKRMCRRPDFQRKKLRSRKDLSNKMLCRPDF